MSFLRNQLQTLLGEEYPQFRAAVETPAKKSFRVNTLKASVSEIKETFRGKIKSIPWCKEGFWFEGGCRIQLSITWG
ncbi:MAG: hypothetical protein GF334_06665 [Candidatus Altiarchaeales archaeon]|nr:hypothetical protein [Candidatus Altiarchaeales archaeon]